MSLPTDGEAATRRSFRPLPSRYPPVIPQAPLPSPLRPRALMGRSPRPPPHASSQRPLRAERGRAPTWNSRPAHIRRGPAPSAPPRPRLPVQAPPRACAVSAPPVSRAGEGRRQGRAVGFGLGAPGTRRPAVTLPCGPCAPGGPASRGKGVFRWGRGLSVSGRPVPAPPPPFEVGAAEAGRRVPGPGPGGDRDRGLGSGGNVRALTGFCFLVEG